MNKILYGLWQAFKCHPFRVPAIATLQGAVPISFIGERRQDDHNGNTLIEVTLLAWQYYRPCLCKVADAKDVCKLGL